MPMLTVRDLINKVYCALRGRVSLRCRGNEPGVRANLEEMLLPQGGTALHCLPQSDGVPG